MTKNIFVTAIVALVVSLVVGFYFTGSQQSKELGGLSERDISAVSLKVGSPTKKFSVNSSGTALALGTTTASTQGDVVVEGTATTTLMLSSSSSTKGGCIQMETVTGGVVKITVSGTTISAIAGTCK